MKIPASEVWPSIPTRTVTGGRSGGSNGCVRGTLGAGAAGAGCAAVGATTFTGGAAGRGVVAGGGGCPGGAGGGGLPPAVPAGPAPPAAHATRREDVFRRADREARLAARVRVLAHEARPAAPLARAARIGDQLEA